MRKKWSTRKRSLAVAALAAIATLVGTATMTIASSPSGVTPTLLSRGTYDSFKVRSYPEGSGLFKAEAKTPIDVVVRRHDYVAGGYTGWHSHPYPVFITVIQGQVTFYEYDDPPAPRTSCRRVRGTLTTAAGTSG